MADSDLQKADLQKTAQSLAATQADEQHVDWDVLAEYHAENLDADESDRIRRHLVDCRVCADALLGIASFDELEAPASSQPMQAEDLERNWQRFQAELPAEASAVEPVREIPESARPPLAESREERKPWWWIFWTPQFAYAFAGIVLLVSVGLPRPDGSVPIEDPRTLRGNIQIAELVVGDASAERSVGSTITLSEDSDGLLLLLPSAADASVRIEIEPEQSSSDSTIRETVLNRDSDGLFTVELPRAWLRPGIYQVRMYSAEGDQALETFTFELRVLE